ncbi:MAG: peptidase M14 [Gammaproteobacteria bacterium]|nr:peptidase M14 [Gammaproteobacteria bacterium]
MLNQLDQIPTGLLDLDATELHDVLGGPTLIELDGRRKPRIFVSVLMHGNETSGWGAIQKLLRKYQTTPGQVDLPRAMTLFIGNTLAAKNNVRHLLEQPDFNRVWPGSELPQCEEHGLMEQVVDIVTSESLFASIDIHNNTGLNPHYACVNNLNAPNLHLAALFGRTVVYFIRPVGVQAMAMSSYCPAVTLECGRVDSDYGVTHALEYLDACLHLSELPTHAVAPHDLDLFHTTATVKVKPDVTFGYQGSNLDLELPGDLERLNFTEIEPGMRFGRVRHDDLRAIAVCDEYGKDVAEAYFEVNDGELRTRLTVMPSMLTPDVEVIRQDCLCYLMERFPLPATA